MKKFLKQLEDKLFMFFFKRYINYDLDQWDRWEFETKHGKVYVQISRNSDGYNYEKIK